VHVLGISAALVAVPALIALTVSWNASGISVAAASIYGTTLLAMLTFSGLYNMLDQSAWSGVLRRLDHAGIYFKIAGTYTPFTLTTGAPSVGLLTTIWSAALVGAVPKLVNPSRFRWPALALYLLMGWAGVFAGSTFLSTLGPAVLTLILAGGLLYTAGVVFFLWEKLPFHNTIWHIFVLTASGLFFAAVTLHLA
jgi:hemolysin III